MNCNNVFSFYYYCLFNKHSKLHSLPNGTLSNTRAVINDNYKEKQRKNAAVARRIYNISFGVIILIVGLVVLFIDKINNDTLTQYFDTSDVLLRYMFGGLCIIYGIFRLYRGIKNEF